MLKMDSLLNIDPATKNYTRRDVSQIVHTYEPAKGEEPPNFGSVGFERVDTSVPVHIYLNQVRGLRRIWMI